MNTEGKTKFMPRGMATGIGSLPYTEPKEALKLVMEYLPDIPHWPQLPARGSREHFVHQFLRPLVDSGMLAFQEDRWGFATEKEDCAECMTCFYTSCLSAENGDAECVRAYLPSPDSAAGWHAFMDAIRKGESKNAKYVKGQIVGPLTVALELKDQDGVSAYYKENLRDVLIRNLALNARAQAEEMASSGHDPIVFVDDPAISACGSRLHLALDRQSIVDDLKNIFSAIRSGGGLAGLHACQAIDWSIATDSDVDILSIDVYRFGDSLAPYADRLRSFLEKGGAIAWGVVPTLDDPFKESTDSLWSLLRSLWERLFDRGPDIETVLEQSLITPACGLGLLKIDEARRIYSLAAGISRRIRDQ